mmetsp:Transcript_6311/g.13156  ORF Transcript_6311/g.13156 Transcript_6311/m.13156 type:complete len:210 (+) Transcript_6311:493-1122(+)
MSNNGGIQHLLSGNGTHTTIGQGGGSDGQCFGGNFNATTSQIHIQHFVQIHITGCPFATFDIVGNGKIQKGRGPFGIKGFLRKSHGQIFLSTQFVPGLLHRFDNVSPRFLGVKSTGVDAGRHDGSGIDRGIKRSMGGGIQILGIKRSTGRFHPNPFFDKFHTFACQSQSVRDGFGHGLEGMRYGGIAFGKSLSIDRTSTETPIVRIGLF